MVMLFNVFVVGMTIMAIEMSAFRILAPYFGTTQIIITNIIGCILLAIALGNWCGGKLGDRYQSERGLYWIIFSAGILCTIVYLLIQPVLSWSITALSNQEFTNFASTLILSTALLGLPFVVLGMVSPYVVRIITTQPEHVGTRAGSVFLWGTLGSLLGTYLPTFVFIPLIGSAKTLLGFIAVLFLVGVFGLVRTSAKRAVICLGLGVLLNQLPSFPTQTMGNVVTSQESIYNLIQVVKKDQRNFLFLNEGHGYHSVFQEGHKLVGGVWDYFLALPALQPRAHAATPNDPLRVLIVGLAGGTIANAYHHFLSDSVIVEGVEIDPEITKVAITHFGLDTSKTTVHAMDGRTFLARTKTLYDIIIVDAYKQPYIPFHLATREFFELSKKRLKKDGVLGINVATFEKDSELLNNIGHTLNSTFRFVQRIPIANDDVQFSNTILAATNTVPNQNLSPSQYPTLPVNILNRVSSRIAAVSSSSSAKIFTDDWAPIEWYTDKSLFSFFD